MLLDGFIPNYFQREVHHFAVRADPVESYKTVCAFDMASIPWIRGLFQLRTILDPAPITQLTLRDAYTKGAFIRLHETPNQELVVGAIGKIWRPALQFEQVEPEEFVTYNLAGYGKVAWSMRCEARKGEGTLITFELRIGATDSYSMLKMRSYFSLIGPFSRTIRRSVFNQVGKQLGNFYESEQTRNLPGDDAIDNPAGQATTGITIEAPPEAIWPWLVQMGCLRGGWYSYDWLDNGGSPSAARIMPQWQNLRSGDTLPATPNGREKFIVVSVEPYQSLLLGGCVNTDTGETKSPRTVDLPEHYWRSTWSFVLEPQTPSVTRLVVRARADFRDQNNRLSGLRTWIVGHIHNFMEAKQLRNIKRMSEQMYALSLTAA